MTILISFSLILVALILVAVLTVRDMLGRARVKRSIRRAFPAKLTAFVGQTCTRSGTGFKDLTRSMLDARR